MGFARPSGFSRRNCRASHLWSLDLGIGCLAHGTRAYSLSGNLSPVGTHAREL